MTSSAAPIAYWQTSRFRINLTIPQVMGIVNITPDSFAGGGQQATTAQVLQYCERLVREGAAVLDLGAESSRPGSTVVPMDVELARLLPVVREVVQWGVPISVDTYKAGVMQAVLDMGVDAINDIWALRQPGAQVTVAQHPRCGVCLMHMHRDPQTMQTEPMHGPITETVAAFLYENAQALHQLGVAKNRIVLDPGIGFGKTVEQNFELLARQDQLLSSGYSVLAGWSRKSSLGVVTGLETGQRLVPSIAAALLAVVNGARIVRVHDVADTVAGLKIWQKMRDDDDHPDTDTDTDTEKSADAASAEFRSCGS